jgi:hypothetical protein
MSTNTGKIPRFSTFLTFQHLEIIEELETMSKERFLSENVACGKRVNDVKRELNADTPKEKT